MRILITFTGFHDPYSESLIGGQEQPGPILSLVEEMSFDRVMLLSTPRTQENSKRTEKALCQKYENLSVSLYNIELEDPTNYKAIMAGIRSHLHDIVDETPGAERFISVTSGTPQMHSCWLLLVASGEIPARILNIRPKRYITPEYPLVEEVDLKGPAIPRIIPAVSTLSLESREPIFETEMHSVPDPAQIMQQLGMVGDHPTMKRAVERAAAMAAGPMPILVLGETGTGKELFAKFIHRMSDRREGPFVPLNCGSIPTSLIENELFGHKRGAYTGAVKDHKGKFERAHGGTLFLDEIGELPLEAQSRLLRVLEDGMVEPIGSQQAVNVDVRIVAATNRDLGSAITEKTFREDLYYRLNGCTVKLPALRERRGDIPKIALHLLERANRTQRYGRQLSQEALRQLEVHDWPGNVRELRNAVERSLMLCREHELSAADLEIQEPVNRQDPLMALPEPFEGFSLGEFIDQVRMHYITRALEITGGNQSKAARLLDCSAQAVNQALKGKKS
jgi:transcriptional regulator with PAS, ATPase and Fis domain